MSSELEITHHIEGSAEEGANLKTAPAQNLHESDGEQEFNQTGIDKGSREKGGNLSHSHLSHSSDPDSEKTTELSRPGVEYLSRDNSTPTDLKIFNISLLDKDTNEILSTLNVSLPKKSDKEQTQIFLQEKTSSLVMSMSPSQDLSNVSARANQLADHEKERGFLELKAEKLIERDSPSGI